MNWFWDLANILSPCRIESNVTILTLKPKEKKMAAKKTTESKAVNQHKRMAMGEKITGMKKGGKVKGKKK